jgi:glycosyltransferase involved in cell wall biosynthesis
MVSVARLVEKKGHRYLIEACNILVRRGISDFICKIVGDGPLRGELEELSSRLGLSDSVQFFGALPSDKVLLAIEESDLFVLPCVVAKDGDIDGMPNVLIEAMALEKPVISTYVSGIPELVKDGSGILIPPEDSEALARAIEEIYYLSYDERKNRGRKGREIIIEEFDLKKNVSEIKKLFLGELHK